MERKTDLDRTIFWLRKAVRGPVHVVVGAQKEQ